MLSTTPIGGFVAPGFEPLRDAFQRNFELHGEVGAACCVHAGGRMVADIWGGTTTSGGTDRYTGDTLQMVLSTTKGVVAVCAHMLAEAGQLDFDHPVVRYWPEFGANGKQGITVRQLFSHTAGLAALDRRLTLADIYAWEPVTRALADQAPEWEPGTAHGYHAVTYGWLAGEVIRRAAGQTVGQYLAGHVAGPLGLDLWIGLPTEQLARRAPLIPAPPRPAGAGPDPFAARLADSTSLLHRSMLNPPELFGAFNDLELARAEVPAVNAIGNARSISRLYAACIGEIDGVRLLGPETVERASRTEATGPDRVLEYETRYGTGFQLPFPVRPMAGGGSFGHYGMGGSLGMAHPRKGFAFAYVMNQMLSPSGADPRSKALLDALDGCLG